MKDKLLVNHWVRPLNLRKSFFNMHDKRIAAKRFPHGISDHPAIAFEKAALHLQRKVMLKTASHRACFFPQARIFPAALLDTPLAIHLPALLNILSADGFIAPIIQCFKFIDMIAFGM